MVPTTAGCEVDVVLSAFTRNKTQRREFVESMLYLTELHAATARQDSNLRPM